MEVNANARDDGRRGFGIPELATAYGLSPGFLRLEILRKKLIAHRLGKRWVILREEWDAYLRKGAA
jgi:hypothetical protein